MRRRPPPASALLLVATCGAAIAACDERSTAPATAPATSTSAPVAASAAPPQGPSAAASPPPTPDAIAAQHVLVAYKGAENAPKGTTRTKAEARARAEEIADKARAGQDFSALVKEHSDDPGSKERMGSVGKFTRDKMVKPFSDAAFALGVGEVSAPVETKFGYHVIKRNQ